MFHLRINYTTIFLAVLPIAILTDQLSTTSTSEITTIKSSTHNAASSTLLTLFSTTTSEFTEVTHLLQSSAITGHIDATISDVPNVIDGDEVDCSTSNVPYATSLASHRKCSTATTDRQLLADVPGDFNSVGTSTLHPTVGKNRPSTNITTSDSIHVSSDNTGYTVETTTPGLELNLAETQIVPGPCGLEVKNVSSIMEYVFAHAQPRNNSSVHHESHPCSTTPSTTKSETVLQTKSVHSSSTSTDGLLNLLPRHSNSGNNLSEILIVPNGENGTISMNLSDLFQSVFERANISSEHEVSTMSLLDGVNSTDSKVNSSAHNSQKLPAATEVKFQVSGMNNGSVKPLHGGMPPQIYVPNSEHLRNVSRILRELSVHRNVDNTSMTVFAETISGAVSQGDIQEEPQITKSNLFKDVMKVAEHLINHIDTADDISVSTDTVDFVSKRVNDPVDTNVTAIDVDFGKGRDGMRAKVSTNIFGYLNTSEIRLSTLTYHNLDTLSKATNMHISSPVMAVTIQAIHGNKTHRRRIHTTDAISFEMRTYIEKQKQESERQCSFWNFTLSNWSTTGCDVTAKNASHTSCTCNHLTNFAILVMYVETKDVSIQSEQALFTLTTVGCSLSIACLLMTLIAYIYLQMLSKEKIMIHANLSLALLLAQIVFVSSSDAYRDPTACKVVAVLLHFLFMAAFSWMMVEGIALYLCCTKGIFNHQDMRVKYFLLGWGVPLVIVIISFAARFPDYGNGPQYSCWLSIDDGLIWAFLGPMLVVVLLNMIVMGLVVKVFLTLKTNTEKTEVARLKGSIRAMFTLLPLLGLTWILSLLVPYSVVFHYFFVIANTVQGMCIFFLHCICNEEIRKKFSEKRRRWSTTRTASDAEMTFPSRRKLGSFDAVKAAAAATQLSTDYARRNAWT